MYVALENLPFRLMETTAELKRLLKALRLSPLLSTLPERVAYDWGRKLTLDCDRLAHNAHQMIIEGESCKKKEGVHQDVSCDRLTAQSKEPCLGNDGEDQVKEWS